MNDSVVRLGVVEGEYHWHKHDDDDEFFYVVEGPLFIDLRRNFGPDSPSRRARASSFPRESCTAPAPPQRTVMLMVENAGIVPTGD